MSNEAASNYLLTRGAQDSYGSFASFGLAMAGGISWLSFLSLPYMIALLIKRFSLAPEVASWVASGEVLALACSASLFGRYVATHNKSILIIIGLAAALTGTIASALPISLLGVIVSRIIFGAALGVVSAAANSLAAAHPKPESSYAYMIVGLSVIFCVVMYIEPLLGRHIGTASLPVLQACIIVACGWLAIFLPYGRKIVADKAIQVKLTIWVKLVLTSIFVLFLANSVAWAFAEQAAAKVGFSLSVVGPLFTVSGGLMLVGGLVAAWLGERRGFLVPLLLGFGSQVFSSLAIYSMNHQYAYFTAMLVFNAALAFALPFAQAVLVELDASGTAVTYSGAAVNFGGGFGPVAGGLLIPFGFQSLGYSAALLSLVGILMVVRGAKLAERQLVHRKRTTDT